MAREILTRIIKAMARRKSPRDATCPHCRRRFTAKGLKEHQRHVKCSPSSTAIPRTFERVRCKHCNKSFHSTNSLRVHVATTHEKEYARSPGSMKDHKVALQKRGSATPKDNRQLPPDARHTQSPERRHADTHISPNASRGHDAKTHERNTRRDLDANRAANRLDEGSLERKMLEQLLRRQQLQRDASNSIRK